VGVSQVFNILFLRKTLVEAAAVKGGGIVRNSGRTTERAVP
jgi:hypothetical protein